MRYLILLHIIKLLKRLVDNYNSSCLDGLNAQKEEGFSPLTKRSRPAKAENVDTQFPM